MFVKKVASCGEKEVSVTFLRVVVVELLIFIIYLVSVGAEE